MPIGQPTGGGYICRRPRSDSNRISARLLERIDLLARVQAWQHAAGSTEVRQGVGHLFWIHESALGYAVVQTTDLLSRKRRDEGFDRVQRIEPLALELLEVNRGRQLESGQILRSHASASSQEFQK